MQSKTDNIDHKPLFYNKSLLVLGSNVSSDDIVRYAKENGAYVVVADYYPPEKSSAKLLANESLCVSTADIDSLGKFIEERDIDGIIAGISEFNILNAMTLAEKYKLPFYCTRDQWNKVENKEQFRALCNMNKVPCPQTYYCGEKIPEDIISTFNYPVIIKPVDSCMSAGVHICLNERELKEAEADSLAHSSSNRVIVEQFIDGYEFTAHYTICNGVPTLSSVDNRYSVAVHEGSVTTIPSARVYPSLFIDRFILEINQPMMNLCHSLDLENGILFIQGIYNPLKGFYIFEGGLRSAGEAPYRFLTKVNGINYIHLLVEHALLGKCVSFKPENDDPYLKGKTCGIVSFVAKHGVVSKIEGLEEAIANTPSVLEYENRYPIGSETPDGDTLRQIMIRFIMACDSRKQLSEDIAYLNNRITILDEYGKDMVIKLKPEMILSLN